MWGIVKASGRIRGRAETTEGALGQLSEGVAHA
jgi:hypothetical protein